MTKRRGIQAVLLVLLMVFVSLAPMVNVAAQEIDSDGDGFSDKYERLVGTDPEDPNDYPGKDDPGPDPDPTTERYDISVLPSGRIVAAGEVLSAAVYVSKDGELLDGQNVHFIVYSKSIYYWNRVHQEKKLLEDGRSSFKFTPSTVGAYLLVATMDPQKNGIGIQVSSTVVADKAAKGQCGFETVAAYQRFVAIIDAGFKDLLPGMRARFDIRLYELAADGLTEDLVEKYIEGTGPLNALEIYRQVQGRTYVQAVGPSLYSEKKTVECGPNGGLWELPLSHIGQYTFRVSAYEDGSGITDSVQVNVHDPIVISIGVLARYRLFDQANLQVRARSISIDLSREEFASLMAEAGGNIETLLDLHPEHSTPVQGKVNYYLAYVLGDDAILVKDGTILYNGNAFDTLEFPIPGKYLIVVTTEDVHPGHKAFKVYDWYYGLPTYSRYIDVVSDITLTTFPNKALYFHGEDVKLSTVFLSGNEVVRDIPVAVYVDGRYVGNASVLPGEFVIEHDLGTMEKGYHIVRTFPVTHENALKVMEGLGLARFSVPWNGVATFSVRGIGIYLHLPEDVVRGMPVSLRVVALDSPLHPCSGCDYIVEIKNGMNGREVARGVLDDAGSAIVEFEYPDLFLPTLHVTVIKGDEEVSFTRNLVPRAQTVDGITITNKPIYKAGETVMMRYLVWNADILAPASGDLDVVIKDPIGREVLREMTELDESGSASLKAPLSTDAPDGDYTIRAYLDGRTTPVIDRTFKVEDYRTPVVEVVFDDPTTVIDEMTENATIPFTVQYVFGKGVTEGTVTTEVGYINEGETDLRKLSTTTQEVTGEWPMEIPLKMDQRQDPGDTVYAKVSFTDRFGHEAEAERTLTVTESMADPKVTLSLDREVYEPGDPVRIDVSVWREVRSLGETTIESVGGEVIGYSIKHGDDNPFNGEVVLDENGDWTGYLTDLGVDPSIYHVVGEDTEIKVEMHFLDPDARVTWPVVASDTVRFRTLDHSLRLDREEYTAGDDALVYIAIRDLVNEELLDGTYTLSISRKGDSENALFSAMGDLDSSSVSLVWHIPETLATDIYVVTADIDGTVVEQEITINDPTPRGIEVTPSAEDFRPGDRVEFKITFPKPHEGLVYIDYEAGGRMWGTHLRFNEPKSMAVVALETADWRSPVRATAYFVSYTGEMISDTTVVDRVDPALDIIIETNKPEYEPGDIPTLTIRIADTDGGRVTGAMLSLAIIDATIFDIAEEYDDAAWMSTFGTPLVLDRGYDLVSGWAIQYGGPGAMTYRDVAFFYGLPPNSESLDADGDGLDNYYEYDHGLGLLTPDTDGDGMTDGYEVQHSLDPADPADGLMDMDRDGMPNGWEALHGLDPLDEWDATDDNDRDNLTAIMEFDTGTDPNDWDSDGDGMPDGYEMNWGLDPTEPMDAQGDMDGDGYTNLEEFWLETMPGRPLNFTLTDTTDTDGGGVPDIWEAHYGFNPFDPADDTMDSDKDGWTNFMEYLECTDPTKANTDGDKYEFDSTDPNPLWQDDTFEWGSGGDSGGGSGGGNGGSGNGGNGGEGQGSGSGSGGGSGTGSGQGTGGGTGAGEGDFDWGGDDGPGITERIDSDEDGLFDDEELTLGTNPYLPDTDGDGIPDPVDKDPLNPEPPSPSDDGSDTPSINPFIPHKAESTIIESFHQRKWFTDTAYWAPDLALEGGVIKVSFLLPDNIGKWRVKASAWTKDLRAGETIIEVNAYKSLFVEPVVPTDVYQDDEVTFKARVFNFDDEAKTIDVILTAGEWLRAFGENERKVTIGPREVKEVPFFVKIDGMHEQEVKLGVSDGTYSDAVTAKTYVEPNGAIKTQHWAGDIDREEVMLVEYYPEYIPGSKVATLKLSAGYDGLFVHGAATLGGYPYDCTEQTMSKLLVNILMWRYMKAKGTLEGAEKERLRDNIYSNLNRLYVLQHEDGGWGWWETDTSDPWMSSYVIYGYSLVKEQGFFVEGNSLNGGWQYLLSKAERPTVSETMWKGTSWLKGKDTTMTATVLHTLAASGYPGALTEVVTYLNRMMAEGEMADAYTVTLYGLALDDMSLDPTPATDWLKANMVENVSWEAGNSLGGAVETTGWATYLLVRTGTEAKDLRPTLSWLSSQRRNGAWSTTSDSVANLFAITEVMEHAEQPDADVMVYVNGEVVAEFKGLNEFNFASFNDMFEAFDLSEHLSTTRVNEVKVVKEGTGDLFFELTNEQYLRAGVEVSFQAAAQGRVGDLIEMWMEVLPDATSNVDIVDLTVGVPQAPGLTLVDTRKQLMTGGEDTGTFRYIHTFAAREKGRFTLAPIVVSYQLTAGEAPSGVIRDYFGPVDVLVKVPLSELSTRPGLVEDDLGDLVNDTRDNLKDRFDELRDDIKDRLNETRDRINDTKEDIKDKVDDVVDDTEVPTIRDKVDITKRTGGRSLDIEEESTVEIGVEAMEDDGTEREEKVTIVDFVPLELEVVTISEGGTYEDGKITWEVGTDADSTLTYTVRAREEFSGELGRTVALLPEEIAGVSNIARMVFTARNFVVVRDSQDTAYAGELSHVSLTVMTTGDGLWYAAIEDYAPAGATIDEDSVAANIDDNVLAYTIKGNRVTFFVRKAVNLTLDYAYTPSLVGTTVAPPAKAYPMYETANSASSNSEVVTVDYPPVAYGGGGSGGYTPDTDILPAAPARIEIGPEDIVVGDLTPVEGRLTTLTVAVHNKGGTKAAVTLSIYDYDHDDDKKALVGYSTVTVWPGESRTVTIEWRPQEGPHSIIVEAEGGGMLVQATVPMEVEAAEEDGGWTGQMSAEAVMTGPGLLLVLLAMISVFAAAGFYAGRRRAAIEEKALQEARARRRGKKVKKVRRK